jgi:hypothetical protein
VAQRNETDSDAASPRDDQTHRLGTARFGRCGGSDPRLGHGSVG